MLKEVLDYLNPSPGEIFVDATVGGGGHSSAIVQRLLPGGCLIALDRDIEAIKAAGERLKAYRQAVILIQANYKEIRSVLSKRGIKTVDGLLLDLGVSSHQLDSRGRGFSYQTDAPLDMRMGNSQELTAADLVNDLSEDKLAEILWQYGEERWAARIAAFIVEARSKNRIVSTGQLVDIIKAAIPAGARRSGPHPAKRTFQALRIAINEELEALSTVLGQVEHLLNPGGRIGVISFHSLEDRIVKKAFRQLSGHCTCPPGFPVCRCGSKRVLSVITRRPVTPSMEEAAANPRARSAKLRVARRVLNGMEGE